MSAPALPARQAVDLTEALRDELTQDFCSLLGWDPQSRMLAFPAEHPTLGWRPCTVEGCGKISSAPVEQLCQACVTRWRSQGQPDLASFRATGRTRRTPGRRECAVTDCRRAGLPSQLCGVHAKHRLRLGVPLEDFLTHPQVEPLLSVGPCLVEACTRHRPGNGAYCETHASRWWNARRRAGDVELDEQHWRRTTRPISEDNLLSLRGLPDRVVYELLFALQWRTGQDVKCDVKATRPLINLAREQQVTSLRDLPTDAMSKYVRKFHGRVLDALHQFEDSPTRTWESDRWALSSFGHQGTLRFDQISQPWLKEAAKAFVFEELPNRHSSSVASGFRIAINALARFSESLRRHRDDDGMRPELLARSDVLEFLNWMGYLEDQETISRKTRRDHCLAVRRVLRKVRGIGMTRPGRPLEGLSEDVALLSTDIVSKQRDDDDNFGRDLPDSVMSVLLDHLESLSNGRVDEVRVAVELLMHTGRRPSEVCNLALDCLGREPDDKPVLVWNNTKAGRLGRRLPVSETVAAIIVAQQDRVRARFPDRSDGSLVLLPAPSRNPDGRRAISVDWVAHRHHEWLRELPEFVAPVRVAEGEHTVLAQRPFAKDGIVLYSYRHTYCQRHADAGVPVDVLCDLMDHRSLDTTRGYYRVSKARQREAIERVTTMQFDRHGFRIWRPTETLLDSERVRRGLGEVAVPYGVCTEPANVAAGGGDCPVRYRCVGCDHFRTDISYLPDLEAYLADLLRHRERLRATVAADAWAVAEATPSDEEIARIRALIARVKADVEELDPAAHTEIQDAVTAVRRARHGAVGLGLPRIRTRNDDPSRNDLKGDDA